MSISIGHCSECRWWTRNEDALECPNPAPESPEFGRCSHRKLMVYDSNIDAGPFATDGLYADADWDGFILHTGQYFGCIHWERR